MVWVWVTALYQQTLYPSADAYLQRFVFPVVAESVVSLTWQGVAWVAEPPPDSLFVSFDDDSVYWTPDSPVTWVQVGDSLVVVVHPWANGVRYTAIEITYETVQPAPKTKPSPPGDVVVPEGGWTNYLPENLPGPPDLVVITTPSLLGAARDYAQTHLLLGHLVAIYTTDWVDTRPGGTRQERIRNLLRDLRAVWDSFAVLLMGPVSELPGWNTAVPVHGDPFKDRFPTDYFYSALLSDMLDRDGDGLWGEAEDQVDITPLIPVGRLVVEDSAQVEAYRQKLLGWWSDPPQPSLSIRILADLYPALGHTEAALVPIVGVLDTVTLKEDSGVDITVSRFQDSLVAPHRLVLTYSHATVNKLHINQSPVVEFWRWDGNFLDTTASRFLWEPFACDVGAFDLGGLAPDFVRRFGGPVAAWATVRQHYPHYTQYVYRWANTRLAAGAPVGEAARYALNLLTLYSRWNGMPRYHLMGFHLSGDPTVRLWRGAVGPAKMDLSYVVQGSQVDVTVEVRLSAPGRVVFWRPATRFFRRVRVGSGTSTLTLTLDRTGEADTLWVAVWGERNTLTLQSLVLPQSTLPYISRIWSDTSGGSVWVHTEVVDPLGGQTFEVLPLEGTWDPPSRSFQSLTGDTVVSWRLVEGPLPAYYTFDIGGRRWKIWVSPAAEEASPRLWTAYESDTRTLSWVYDLGSDASYRLILQGATGTDTADGVRWNSGIYAFDATYTPASGETLWVRVEKFLSPLRVWVQVLEDTLIWQNPPDPPTPGGFQAIPGGTRVLGSLPEGARGVRIRVESDPVGFLLEGNLPADIQLARPESLWMATLSPERILSPEVLVGVAIPGARVEREVSWAGGQPLYSPVVLQDSTVLVWEDGGWLHALTVEGTRRPGFPIPVQGIPVRDAAVWREGDTLMVAWPLAEDLFLLRVWPGGLAHGPQGLPGWGWMRYDPGDSTARYFTPSGEIYRYDTGAWIREDSLGRNVMAPPVWWQDPAGGPGWVISLDSVGLVRWAPGGTRDTLSPQIADMVAAGDWDTTRSGVELLWLAGDTLFLGGWTEKGVFQVWSQVGDPRIPDARVAIPAPRGVWAWNGTQVVRVDRDSGVVLERDFSGSVQLLWKAYGVTHWAIPTGEGLLLPAAGNQVMGVALQSFPVELGQSRYAPTLLGSSVVVALDDGRFVVLRPLPGDTGSVWPTTGHDLHRTWNATVAPGSGTLVWPEEASGVASLSSERLPVLRLLPVPGYGFRVYNPAAVRLRLDLYDVVGRLVHRVTLTPHSRALLRAPGVGIYFLRVHPSGVVRAPRKVVVFR